MITAAAIPTLKSCIRTELHHPEGHTGPGKCMSVSTGTDKGINKGGIILLGEGGSGKNHKEQEEP